MEKENNNPRINSLFKLADRCWTEYDSRRSYEWKINFGLWTSLGVVLGFAIKERFIIGPQIWIPIGVIAIFYLRWQLGLFTSNRHDQNKRHCYETQIRYEQKITLDPELNTRPGTSGSSFLVNWSHSAQIIFTFSLLILFGLILSGEIKPTQEEKPEKNKNEKFEKHQRHRHFHQKIIISA